VNALATMTRVPRWRRLRVPAVVLAALLGCAATASAQTEPDAKFGPAELFSFERLKARAEALAQEPYQPYEFPNPELLDRIDYDAHWRINFDKDRTVFVNDVPLQFFHLGRYFRAPVRMSIVEGGESREILYSEDYFTMPEDSPAKAIEDQAGFAGFRIMREGLETDWISFLGASYFRTDGAETQYGLSARALAIDTGLPTPEEFPRFTEFYIEDGTTPETDVIIYALLDSPSVTGAYRMAAQNQDAAGQVLEISSALYVREPVERLGIAPLTSMYWYSESNRVQAFDWRPEVHDSDGLAMVTGGGERIWRPLNNPDRVATSSFSDENIQGFGLLQRDRSFDHYQDDGVFYNRRPSVWVEPMGDWGKGAVQLVELPSDDEIYDNIVAYWLPADPPEAGESRIFDYRLYWAEDQPHGSELARTIATRVGAGGIPGQPRPADEIRFVIDFEGPRVQGLTAEDNV
jgi:periplasmic glucans biosynthesis protein